MRAVVNLDKNRLLSAGDDGRLLLWNEGGVDDILSAPEGALEALAVSPNGALVAFGGLRSSLTLWDLKQKRAVDLESMGHSSSEWRRGHGTRTYEGWLTRSGVLGFSPDGTRLVAVVGYDNLVCWDVESGAVLHSAEAAGHFYYSEAGVFCPGGVIYNGLAFASPEQVEVWNWGGPCKEPLSRFDVRGERGLICMEISPSKTLVLGYENGSLEAFDMSYPVPRPLAVAKDTGAAILSMAAGPDGYFAIGGDDGSLKLWQPSEQLLTAIPGRVDGGLWCTAQTFSVDGSELIVGHGNGVVTRAAWR